MLMAIRHCLIIGSRFLSFCQLLLKFLEQRLLLGAELAGPEQFGTPLPGPAQGLLEPPAARGGFFACATSHALAREMI